MGIIAWLSISSIAVICRLHAVIKILAIGCPLFFHLLPLQSTPEKGGVALKLLREVSIQKSGADKADKLLQLGQHYIDLPGELKQDITKANHYADLAYQTAKESHYIPGQAQSFVLKAQIVRERGETQTGKKFAAIAIDLFNKSTSTKYAANAYLEMANYYSIEEPQELSEKSGLYERAVKLLSKSDPNTLKLAHAVKFSGELLSLQNKTMQAVGQFQLALRIYKKVGHGELQHILMLIGDEYTSSGDPVKGLALEMQALETAIKYQDSSMTLCAIYNKLAFTYSQLNQQENAFRSLEKALIVAKKNNDLNTYYSINSSLSLSYIVNRRYNQGIAVAKAALNTLPVTAMSARTNFTTTLLVGFTRLKQFKEAKSYLDKLISLVDSDQVNNNQKGNAYHAIIVYYQTIGDYESVRHFFFPYKALLESDGDLFSKINLEQFSFQIDSANGEYLNAIKRYKRYIYFSDSLASLKRNKEVERMESLFQLREKNNEILIKAKNIKLLTDQTAMQKKMIAGEKYSRALLYVAIILLLLLLFFAYSRYRNKQKANEILSIKQTEINSQNATLKDLLTEREWLLKEIHHRVKNNLQIIISLLNSQSAYLSDPEMLRLINDSQHRLQAIALIHQKLYQHENSSAVDLSNYIHELAGYLQDSFSNQEHIKFKITAENVMLDVSQAVSLGLILNEALTNSLKYAFPLKQGEVSIDLRKVETSELILTIQDNGIGLNENLLSQDSPTLGMKLITGLSKQLKADLSIENAPGVKIVIRWRAAIIAS